MCFLLCLELLYSHCGFLGERKTPLMSEKVTSDNIEAPVRKIKTLDSQISDIGDVYFGPNQGIAFLYQKNAPGLDNLIFSEKASSKPPYLLPDAPIIFNDVTIGKSQNITKTPQDHRILLFFKYNSDQEKNINAFKLNPSEYVAVPFLTSGHISCSICGFSFIKNQEPCECIESADYIIVDNPILEKVYIYSVRQYKNIYADARERLYMNHFGGLINNIVVIDDI